MYNFGRIIVYNFNFLKTVLRILNYYGSNLWFKNLVFKISTMIQIWISFISNFQRFVILIFNFNQNKIFLKFQSEMNRMNFYRLFYFRSGKFSSTFKQIFSSTTSTYPYLFFKSFIVIKLLRYIKSRFTQFCQKLSNISYQFRWIYASVIITPIYRSWIPSRNPNRCDFNYSQVKTSRQW